MTERLPIHYTRAFGFQPAVTREMHAIRCGVRVSVPPQIHSLRSKPTERFR